MIFQTIDFVSTKSHFATGQGLRYEVLILFIFVFLQVSLVLV